MQRTVGGQPAAGQRPLTARYALEEVLARGGVGVVWRARDLRLGRPVAVKVLHGAQADPHFRTRFRAEAQHAARLSHPNIAAVFDYGEEAAEDGDEPTPFLVMELVEGESLADLLARRGRLGVGRTLSILRQLSSALAAAHEAGVVHRDVKPANVLVRPDGIAKITDFGIAASAASAALTETGQVVGTARYLSPEQARGRRGTPASDVYALGLVGYECLAGRPAFDGPDPVQVAAQQVAEPPPPLPPDVPQQVRGLVGTATAKDPAHRIPDGAAFRDAVDRLLDTERRAARSAVPPRGATAARALDAATVDGLRPLPPVSAGRPVPRRRRWWVGAGAGALLCGVAAVLVLLGVAGTAGSADHVRARVGAGPVGTQATSGPTTAGGVPPAPAVAPDPAGGPPSTGAGTAGAATTVATGAVPGAGGVRGTARGQGSGTAATGSGRVAAGTPATGATTVVAAPAAGTGTPGSSPGASSSGSGPSGGTPSGTGPASGGSTSTGTTSGSAAGASSSSGSGATGTSTSGSSASGSSASGSSASGSSPSGSSTSGSGASSSSSSGTSTSGTSGSGSSTSGSSTSGSSTSGSTGATSTGGTSSTATTTGG